jgi:ribosomal protein L40E
MAKGDSELNPAELGNTYVSSSNRYVVSLIVGYDDNEAGEVRTPHEAARAALGLTTDGGAADTHWYVYDRQTKILHLIEQGEFDPECGAELCTECGAPAPDGGDGFDSMCPSCADAAEDDSDEEICDECGATIPDDAGDSIVNLAHSESCSLHPSNVVGEEV